MRIIKRLFLFLLPCLFLFNGITAFAQNTSPADGSETLIKIEQDSIQYFLRLSDKVSGLTRDSSRPGSPASISATGFSLAAISIAESHGWISNELAVHQIDKTLDTLLDKVEHQNGFFYHFLDARSGKRVWDSEASSIDTALLLAGALVASQHFPNSSIKEKVSKLYERVDWPWMMNGSKLMCMGWKPESGFLPYYWDSYNELILLLALAIGSPTHPIDQTAWQAWDRKTAPYNGKEIIFSHSGSLFTYQFSHAFIDFKNLRDHGTNYFQNSILASIANREYSSNEQNIYTGYSENSWGLSASLGPGGYRAYGAKPGEGIHDGTIAPYAAISSIVFTPEESTKTIVFFLDHYKDKLYGPYGFKDAFNLDKHWWAEEYLGIDQGITVLMLENYLFEGSVWKKFMGLDAIQRWVNLCSLNEEKSVIPDVKIAS